MEEDGMQVGEEYITSFHDSKYITPSQVIKDGQLSVCLSMFHSVPQGCSS